MNPNSFAAFLFVLDGAVDIFFIFGFLIPRRFRRWRIAHCALLWSVFFAQALCGRCPLLIWANLCKGLPISDPMLAYQPTLFNALASIFGEFWAKFMMNFAIFGYPPLRTCYLWKKQILNLLRKPVEPARHA